MTAMRLLESFQSKAPLTPESALRIYDALNLDAIDM
jgi:hypothetical protein